MRWVVRTGAATAAALMGYDPKTGLTITIGTNLATVPSGEGSALTLLKAIMPLFYGAGWLGGDPAAGVGSARPTR